jgi:hypothetical protein
VLLALDLPLFLAGYALTLAAIARFVRVRTGGRDLDGLIDAAIVGCAAAVVVKQWVRPADGLVDATALGMYVVMVAVVVAIAVRLLLLSSDSAAGWLLFTGSVAGLAANLAFVASFAPNREYNDPCTDRLAPRERTPHECAHSGHGTAMMRDMSKSSVSSGKSPGERDAVRPGPVHARAGRRRSELARRPSGKVTAVFSGIPVPFLNMAVMPRGPAARSDLEAALDWLAAYGLPYSAQLAVDGEASLHDDACRLVACRGGAGAGHAAGARRDGAARATAGGRPPR